MSNYHDHYHGGKICTDKRCDNLYDKESQSKESKTVVSKNEVGQTLVNGVIRRSDCENKNIPSQSEYCGVPSCKGCYFQRK